MNKMEQIFNVKKPIIGMLHLDYLVGENFKGLDIVLQKALADIKALEEGGVDGILIENWKEDSIGEFVSKETAKNFMSACKKLSKYIHIPFGINVLNNDYKVAFTVAKEVKATFIELDVFVDDVESDFENNIEAIQNPFQIHPNPKGIIAYAKSIGADNIPLFVFVQPKHYKMLDKEKSIQTSVKEAIKNGATAVLVTKHTGFAPTIELINEAKSASEAIPVGIGSGFNSENASEFLKIVDFAVIGTSIKINSITDNPVDKNKVINLMKIVRAVRI
ncbi:MAG: BtpA/SgcQ family protein [Candidatus Woesebacteria bacterium]|nr:BtpA/SgcQ family protein [Candidatus Woesebacteria bacterium]